MTPPALEIAIPGHDLVARPVDPADADEWFAFAVMPEVKQHTRSRIAKVDDVRGMIERSRAGDGAAPVTFALRRGSDRKLAGVIGFHSLAPQDRTAEISYALHPHFWLRGIATASCRRLVAWGFDALHLVRIQATTLEANVASQRVLGKCGFAWEGKLRNFRMVDGVPRDFLLYATVPSGI